MTLDAVRVERKNLAMYLRSEMKRYGVSGKALCEMARITQEQLDNMLYEGNSSPDAHRRVLKQLETLKGMQP
jgi:hypothetical protein